MFKDFLKTTSKGTGHWIKFLRVALLGFPADPSLVGHRAFFSFENQENVFYFSFSYLLGNLDHIDIHLICYSQYSAILSQEPQIFLFNLHFHPLGEFTPENVGVNVEHSYYLY